MIKMIIFS